MAVKMNPKRLILATGQAIGKDGKAFPVRPDDVPSDEWDPEHLSAWYHVKDAAANLLAKEEAVHRFWQGYAVSLAKKKIRAEGGTFRAWCERECIERRSADNYCRLYQSAQAKWGKDAPIEVALQTTTELYLKFGIVRRQPRPAPAPVADNDVSGKRFPANDQPAPESKPNLGIVSEDELEDDDDEEHDDPHEEPLEESEGPLDLLAEILAQIRRAAKLRWIGEDEQALKDAVGRIELAQDLLLAKLQETVLQMRGPICCGSGTSEDA